MRAHVAFANLGMRLFGVEAWVSTVTDRRRISHCLQFSTRGKIVLPFIFMRLANFHRAPDLECHVLFSRLALCSQYDPLKGRSAGGGTEMATTSDMHTTDRALTDVEFEELLQKTWEMVQNQKPIHPMDQAAESPSWT